MSGSWREIWSPAFLAIFGLNFVLNVSQFIVNALVPKLADSLGASATTIGVVTGLFAATALMVRPFVGFATLRVPNSILLSATCVILLGASACFAFAGDVTTVIAGRLLQGFGMGFLAPVTLAMASHALPERRMASGIGIFSLGQAIGMAIGPALGLWLQQAVGYGLTFALSAGTMAVVAALAPLLRSERPQRQGSRRGGWRSFIAPEALAPAAVIFFLGGAYSVVNAFVILYGEAVGVESIGLFFTSYALALLVSRPIAGPIADRFGITAVIVPGTIVYGIAFLLLSNARSLPDFLIAGAVSAFGYGICQPAVQALALMSVGRDRRGVASNTNYMGLDLSYLILPIAGGALVSAAHGTGATDADAYALMFRLMIIPVAVGLAIFILFARPARRPGDGLNPGELAPADS
jgi:MFS family permease